MSYGLWKLVLLPEGTRFSSDTARHYTIRSRLPKMLPHCVLLHAGKMVYMDGKVQLARPDSLWPMAEHVAGGLRPAWVAPLHPSRHTVRDELVCLYLAGIVSERAFEQYRAYVAEGFPGNHPTSAGGPGLTEGNWHARDLRAPDSAVIGNAWAAEYFRWREHTLRDQLSFSYVIWRRGLHPAAGAAASEKPCPPESALPRGSTLPLASTRRSFVHFPPTPLRKRQEHRLNDVDRQLGQASVLTLRQSVAFCDRSLNAWACYLARYPDVRAQGITDTRAARRHFVTAGYNESRTCQCDGDVVDLIGTSHAQPRREDARAENWMQSFAWKMPMRKLQALGPNHKWCEFPVFGLDNLELLSQLQSALAGTPTGGGANGRGNLLEEERRLKSTATSRRPPTRNYNRNFV